MFTKNSLIKDLENMGLKPTDTVFVHSSYKKVAGDVGVEGGADTIVDAFIEYFGKSGLVVFPSMSWKLGYWVNDKGECIPPFAEDKKGYYPFGNDYDVRTTPCHGLGIIPEIFRKRKGVIRSLCPSSSVSAFGADAKEFCAGHDKSHSSLGWDSPWGKLYDRKAKILFLGIPMANNTFMHVLEDYADLPDLFHPYVWEYTVTDYDGNKYPVSYKRHHPGHNHYYIKVQQELIDAGIVEIGKFGAGQTLIVDAVKETDYMMQKFKKEPKLFFHETNQK